MNALGGHELYVGLGVLPKENLRYRIFRLGRYLYRGEIGLNAHRLLLYLQSPFGGDGCDVQEAQGCRAGGVQTHLVLVLIN